MAAPLQPSIPFALQAARSNQVERVIYPGRVAHPDRAIATLGGAQELSKKFSRQSSDTAKDDSLVQLSLRYGLASLEPGTSDSTHTTSLTSESAATRGFLLCVALDESGNAIDASIAASYERSHSFDRMADFIFRRDPPSALSYVATPGTINGISPSIAQAMGPFKSPVPNRISSLETVLPKPNLFQNFDAQSLDAAEKQRSEFRAVRPKCHSIDQSCDAIPVDPPVPLEHLDLTTEEHDIHTKLVQMFHHQPIWTRRGICRSLSLNAGLYGHSPHFLRLLGSVSYRFLKGPFHNSYIKLGYDPRIAPLQSVLQQSSALNQPIPIRLRSTLWNMLSKRKFQLAANLIDVSQSDDQSSKKKIGESEETAKSSNQFTEVDCNEKPWLQPSPEDALVSPPSFRCFTILPVQVRHPLFEEWKSTLQPLQAYDQINGWIPTESFETLRDAVEKILEGMLTPEELRKLRINDKDHERTADGKRGRQYSNFRRAIHRRQDYGRNRIEELAALAPNISTSTGSCSANACVLNHQPTASDKYNSAALAKKSKNEIAVSSPTDNCKADSINDLSSRHLSHVVIMSHLSNISNLAVIATQESGSDYDVFSGSSSGVSSSGSGSDEIA